MPGLSGVSAWRDSTNFSSGPGAGSGLEVLLQGFPDDLHLQLHGSFGAGDHPADLGVGMTLELPYEDLLELVRRRLLQGLLHWHNYGVEDALIGVVLHQGDDGEVLEGDLGKRVGECTFLAVKAQGVLDVPFQIGEVDRDPELTRPGGEISAFKTAREIANHVVVVTELVDANVTDGLLGQRQPQPGMRAALSFARVFGVSVDILCRGRLIVVGDSFSGHGCLGRDLDLVSVPSGRHMDRRLPGRFQLRVDDSPILLVFLFRELHRAPASSVGMTVEENGWSTTYLVAVVLLAGLAVLVSKES